MKLAKEIAFEQKTTKFPLPFLLAGMPLICNMKKRSLHLLGRSKHVKDSKERLFIYDLDNTMQMFTEIPFFRPQNDT